MAAPDSPRRYLDAALDLIELHALNRGAVDWLSVRQEATHRCDAGMTAEATYPAIEWALTRLGDNHSFFWPPERGNLAIKAGAFDDKSLLPSAHLRDDQVAVLNVPSFLGSPEKVASYADTLCSLIAEFGRQEPRGWIVDLAKNPGGNMLPMLAGLGPLLGTGVIGAFEFADQSQTPWVYDAEGGLWVDHEYVMGTQRDEVARNQEHSPVAVVLSSDTASSGEAVAIAFSGRPRCRSFGQPTRGLSTSNEIFDLADGASIAITVARFVDRKGRVFGASVTPDEYVSTPGAPTYAAAAHWVLR
jgi:carboxyl-terminal processing protease